MRNLIQVRKSDSHSTKAELSKVQEFLADTFGCAKVSRLDDDTVLVEFEEPGSVHDLRRDLAGTVAALKGRA